MDEINYDNKKQNKRVCPKCGSNMWDTTYWSPSGMKEGVQCTNYTCKCTLNEFGQEVKLALVGSR